MEKENPEGIGSSKVFFAHAILNVVSTDAIMDLKVVHDVSVPSTTTSEVTNVEPVNEGNIIEETTYEELVNDDHVNEDFIVHEHVNIKIVNEESTNVTPCPRRA